MSHLTDLTFSITTSKRKVLTRRNHRAFLNILTFNRGNYFKPPLRSTLTNPRLLLLSRHMREHLSLTRLLIRVTLHRVRGETESPLLAVLQLRQQATIMSALTRASLPTSLLHKSRKIRLLRTQHIQSRRMLRLIQTPQNATLGIVRIRRQSRHHSSMHSLRATQQLPRATTLRINHETRKIRHASTTTFKKSGSAGLSEDSSSLKEAVA